MGNTKAGGGSCTAWENLANGIIVQAVDDYRNALFTMKWLSPLLQTARIHNRVGMEKQLEKKQIETKRMISDCMKFFKSDWYETLTSVDSKYLLEKVHEQVKYSVDEVQNGQYAVFFDGKQITERFDNLRKAAEKAAELSGVNSGVFIRTVKNGRRKNL